MFDRDQMTCVSEMEVKVRREFAHPGRQATRYPITWAFLPLPTSPPAAKGGHMHLGDAAPLNESSAFTGCDEAAEHVYRALTLDFLLDANRQRPAGKANPPSASLNDPKPVNHHQRPLYAW